MRRTVLLLTGIALIYSCGGDGLGDADVNYRDFGVNVAVRSAPYLTEENHPDGWGKADCLGCHQNFKHTMATADLTVDQYQDMIETAINSVGASKAINICSACHGLNGVSTETGAQRECLICHNNFERIHFYKGTSNRNQSFHDFNNNSKIDDFDCIVCHWQPDMDGIVEPDTDFGKIGGEIHYKISSLCLTCHSNKWETVSQEPLADTDGNGIADKIINATAPSKIYISYITDDYHGERSFPEDRIFKDIKLAGTYLFYTNHEALACSQCHNPHASNNNNLIIEKAGETIIVEKAIIQSDNTKEVKYAVIDPQTTLYFKNLNFEGVIKGDSTTYDLSNSTELKDYINLSVKFMDNGTDIQEIRNTQSSLCAACHDGTSSYSPINGLGLPKDISAHYVDKKCSECHIHGGVSF